MGGALLDAQEALDEFFNVFGKPSPEELAKGADGVDDSLLRPVKRTNGAWISGSELSDCETHGRRLDLSDEQVVSKLSKGMKAVYDGLSITGDHSGDTVHLLGDLEKISGSVSQIERIFFQSPRMMSAGVGNDGRDRFDKHRRLFDANLAEARASNDAQFAKWAANGHHCEAVRAHAEELKRRDIKFGAISVTRDVVTGAELPMEQWTHLQIEDLPLWKAQQRAARMPDFNASSQAVASDAYDTTPRFDMPWPPGKVGQLALACHRTMVYPNRPLAIAWALFTTAQLVQRSYHVRGLGLNVFLMALDETGGGKEKLSETTSQFFARLVENDEGLFGLTGLIGPSSFASEQATYKRLAKHPRQGCIFNEASFLFEELSGGSVTHGAGKKKALLDLRFKSSFENRLQPLVHSDSVNDTGTCFMPSLTILAEGQPARFYASGDEQSAADGLYNRFMIWDVSRNHRGLRNKDREYTIEKEAVELFEPLARYVCAKEHRPEAMPDVVKVKFSDGALAVSDTYEEAVIDKLSVKKDKIEYELLNRSLPQAWCIAALLAVAENHIAPVICLAQMQWALDVARRERLALLTKFKAQEIGKSDHARVAKLIMVLHDTFKGSGSRLLTTNAKKFGYVSKAWIAETLKGHLLFKEQGFKGATKILDETIAAVIDIGVLIPPPQGKNAEETFMNAQAEKAIHGLAGKAWKIDNDALVLDYRNLHV